jgi:hypothetical protein
MDLATELDQLQEDFRVAAKLLTMQYDKVRFDRKGLKMFHMLFEDINVAIEELLEAMPV